MKSAVSSIDNRIGQKNMETSIVTRILKWTKSQVRKALPATEFNPKRREVLRQGTFAAAALLLGGAAGVLSGCGQESSTPADDTCKKIDDFEDGNLAAEAVRGTWAALPGTTIVAQSPTLRVEGRGPGQIGVVLDAAASYPDNYVGDWDTLFVDLKVGRTSNPDAPFEGSVQLYMDGSGSMGVSQAETNMPVAGFIGFNQVSTQSLYYPLDSQPTYSIASLHGLNIVLHVYEADDYFMEIDKVRVCRTQF